MYVYLFVTFLYNLVASIAPHRQMLSVILNNHLRHLQVIITEAQ